jgi:hypothetical protein
VSNNYLGSQSWHCTTSYTWARTTYHATGMVRPTTILENTGYFIVPFVLQEAAGGRGSLPNKGHQRCCWPQPTTTPRPTPTRRFQAWDLEKISSSPASLYPGRLYVPTNLCFVSHLCATINSFHKATCTPPTARSAYTPTPARFDCVMTTVYLSSTIERGPPGG